MNKNTIRQILTSYERKREQNEIDLKNRKRDIYSKIPDIGHIDDEIAKVGLNLTKSILLNKNNREAIINESKIKMDNLKQEKERLLLTHGISPSELELKYSCNICKDTGFLKNGKKCNCFKQQIINEFYKMSNLDKMLMKQNFANFDYNVFSTETAEGSNKSARENMVTVSDICSKFVSNFDQDNEENLLFYGGTGLGKTYMCNCIAKDLLDKGYLVIYQTSFKILEILEDYKFKRGASTSLIEENYKNLFDCDLLIIDDLGTELNNSFTSSEIFNIINTRLISGKKIIISTNLTPHQLGKTYTQRTLSRILDKFTMLKFIGKDLRWEQKVTK